MEQEISDNNICQKHEVSEQGTEAGSQGLMTEDPKQAITNVCLQTNTLSVGLERKNLYLSFILAKTPGKPTVYLMFKK